jgi:hypothetical protein
VPFPALNGFAAKPPEATILRLNWSALRPNSVPLGWSARTTCLPGWSILPGGRAYPRVRRPVYLTGLRGDRHDSPRAGWCHESPPSPHPR